MSPSTSRAGAVARARAAVAECLSGQLSLHEWQRRAGATSCPQMYVSGFSVRGAYPGLLARVSAHCPTLLPDHFFGAAEASRPPTSLPACLLSTADAPINVSPFRAHDMNLG